MTTLDGYTPRITVKVTNAYLPGPQGPAGGGSGGTGYSRALHPAQFTPGGATLTAANFETALNLAIAAIDDFPQGATVVIPSPKEYGAWGMDAGIELRSLGFYAVSGLVGEVPGVRMQWNSGYSGARVTVDGTKLYNGNPSLGYARVAIENMVFDANGGGGIVLNMKNIISSYFAYMECNGAFQTGGFACKIDVAAGDFINQNCFFLKCSFNGSAQGMFVHGMNTTNFHSCDWNQNGLGGATVGDAQLVMEAGLSFTGSCTWQGGTDYGILVPQGTAGIQISGTPYFESMQLAGIKRLGGPAASQPSFLELDSPSESALPVLVDWDGNTADSIAIRNIRFQGGSQPILKATSVLTTTIEGTVEAFPALPAYFDIDAYTRAGLTHTVSGQRYSGRRSDGKTINEMIAAYAYEIWDFRKLNTLTQVASTTTAVKGLLGNSNAAFVGTAPNYTAASASLGGQPTLSFTNAGGQKMRATINVVQGTGGVAAGIFAVWRRTSAAAGQVQYSGPAIEALTGPFSPVILGPVVDTTVNGRLKTSSGVTSINTAAPGADQLAHAAVTVFAGVQPQQPGTYLMCVADADVVGYNVFFTPANTFTLCHFAGRGTDAGGDPTPDIELAYLAVLNKPIPVEIAKQFLAMAREIWKF